MLDLSRCFFGGDSPTDPAVLDDRMVQTNQSQWRTTKSNDFSLYPFAYVPKWVCTSRWAGAGLPLSYAAFISLAGLGGSCNKPLSTLRFSYVFMKASRLSRSGPSSTQSDLLVCPL